MEQTNVPHVVFLPLPAQGHVKPLMKLAELLSRENFHITFVNTDYTNHRILASTDTTFFPNFHFTSIPDGLPSDWSVSISSVNSFFETVKSVCKPAFRRLLTSLCEETGKGRRPTCIITDAIMSSTTIDVGEELGIPVIAFRTYNASCTWINFHLSKLIEEGEVPFADENMDKPITCIPGFENVFRRRDLHEICRVATADESVLQVCIDENSAMARASALILNTCNQIEAPMISNLGSIFTKIYTIGPVHGLHKSRIKENSSSGSSNGMLWEEDRTCIPWLDSQSSRSVLYISFGSLVGPTGEQMLEFWHGIINSGKRFLWVVRSDSISGESSIEKIPLELKKGTEERGYIVSWAPQEDVLAHPAIGGFLTHSGWNSTLESMVAGVPMICWPRIGDQPVNSRCVSEIWKVGFDMKDTCDRSTVEKLVRDLMESKREEITQSTDKIAKMTRDAVKEGGSSYGNLERLIEDIKSMALKF